MVRMTGLHQPERTEIDQQGQLVVSHRPDRLLKPPPAVGLR